MMKFIVGKKYLFLRNDRNKVFEKYLKDKLTQETELETLKIKNNMIKINCPNKLVMIIPDKYEIYPEDINLLPKRSFTDKINKLLTDKNFNKINVKKELLKLNFLTYYELDTHYTTETIIHLFNLILKKFNLDYQIKKEDAIDKSRFIFFTDLLNSEKIKENFSHQINFKKDVIIKDSDFEVWKYHFLRSQEGKKLFNNSFDKILDKSQLDHPIHRVLNNENHFEKIKYFGSYIDKENKTGNPYFNEFYLESISKNFKINKKIVLVGDSYLSVGLMDLFCFSFKEVIFIRNRNIDVEIINSYQPDYFLFEKAGRFI